MRCFLLPVLHHKPIPTGQSHHRPRWASPPELPPGHSTPKSPPGTGLAQHPAKPTAERARRSCTVSVPSGACCVQKRLKKRKKERKKKGEWVEIITSTVRPRAAAGRSPSGRGSHAAATPNASSLTPEGGIGAGGKLSEPKSGPSSGEGSPAGGTNQGRAEGPRRRAPSHGPGGLRVPTAPWDHAGGMQPPGETPLRAHRGKPGPGPPIGASASPRSIAARL